MKRRRVQLFIPCLVGQFEPQVSQAAALVLEAAGCEVLRPRGQTCCGQPLYNAGFHDDARRSAKRFCRVFEAGVPIVTPSASCAAMVRRQFPRLLGAAGAGVAESVWEFTDFLVQGLGLDGADLGCAFDGSVSLHQSCHRRELGQSPSWGRWLSGFDGLQVVEHENADECCGFGGSFAIKMAPISEAMAFDKVQALSGAEADLVLYGDVGCALNLRGMARRRSGEAAPTMMHLAVFTAQQMAGRR